MGSIELREAGAELPHSKKKGSVQRPSPLVLNLSRRRPTFPHSYPCSIIGPARLNFRVRDGNGCDPRGMTTGKAMKFSVIGFQKTVKPNTEENFEIVSRIFAAAVQEPIQRPASTRTADNSFGWHIQVRPAAEHTVNSQGLLVNPSQRRCDGATTV